MCHACDLACVNIDKYVHRRSLPHKKLCRWMCSFSLHVIYDAGVSRGEKSAIRATGPRRCQIICSTDNLQVFVCKRRREPTCRPPSVPLLVFQYTHTHAHCTLARLSASFFVNCPRRRIFRKVDITISWLYPTYSISYCVLSNIKQSEGFNFSSGRSSVISRGLQFFKKKSIICSSLLRDFGLMCVKEKEISANFYF